MDNLLKKIEIKKQKLDFYRPLPPELVKNLDEWFKIERTYTSNAIEGNTLTRSETALVVEKGLTVAGKSLKEHLETINLALALDYVKKLITKKRTDLTLNDILNIHSLILKKIDDDNSGKFRKVAVRISGSEVVLPTPLKIPELMNDFITWLHDVNDNVVKISADVHLKLVFIHPFIDGNGRAARLFMNLILMQDGYPPIFVKKEERLTYINSIEKVQLKNDYDDYYNFIFKAVERSLDIYLDAIEKSGF